MGKEEKTGIFNSASASSHELMRCFSDLQLAQTLFDLVNDIVFFVKDKEARYIAVNESLVGRCGLESKEQILGKTTAEIYPEPLGDLFLEQDLEVLQTGSRISGRIELHFYPDGSRGWCLTDKIPLFDDEDKLIGVAGISRDLHEPGQQRSEFRQAAQAVDRITREFDRSLRVTDLAEDCGLTVSRFERIIGRVYGITPVQLLAQTRLDAAIRLLSTTDKSITDVAHTCGYADHSAFSRQFRASVGVTPTEYRNRTKSD